jgi:integrase
MSIYKYTTPKGQTRWRAVHDVAGSTRSRRKRVTRARFKTRREAVAAFAELTNVTPGTVDAEGVTVEEFVESRWLSIVDDTVRPTTAKYYRDMLSAYLLPVFGHIVLADLTPAGVDDGIGSMRNKRNGETLAAKTRQNIRGTLLAVCRDATRLGYISENPVLGSTRPKNEKAPPRSWTREQLAVFLEATSDTRFGVLWHVMATTGIRRGEALGLEWSDVTGDTLAVLRSVTVDGDVTAPKSQASVRPIALDKATVRRLDSWSVGQKADRLRWGAGWQDTDAVFTREDGSRLSPATVTRTFQETAAKMGLSTIGPHGLRHTWATLALEAGVPAKVVSSRLGHASVATTLDRYTSVRDVIDRDAAEVVAGIIASA